jgi:hypothetical protein
VIYFTHSYTILYTCKEACSVLLCDEKQQSFPGLYENIDTLVILLVRRENRSKSSVIRKISIDAFGGFESGLAPIRAKFCNHEQDDTSSHDGQSYRGQQLWAMVSVSFLRRDAATIEMRVDLNVQSVSSNPFVR